MSADVIEFRTSPHRFAAAFARYDLVSLIVAAMEELSEELDATICADRRATLDRDFHERWIAHCNSAATRGEIAETRARIAELCDEIRPLILSVVTAREASISARGMD